MGQTEAVPAASADMDFLAARIRADRVKRNAPKLLAACQRAITRLSVLDPKLVEPELSILRDAVDSATGWKV